MEKNIFQLDNEQLKEIARSFRAKVEEGLNTENAEIQCIPTLITPKASSINGKSLVLGLGGTNYRAVIVDLSKVSPTIHPNNDWKRDMSVMKFPGYTHEELFKELADMITGIEREKEMPIGYYFSYSTESMPSGDAELLRWTRGVDIKEMIGEVVGRPLLDYLNERNRIKFTNMKVLNDTVASSFAGLTDSSCDAYIGLVVGTGTSMATFIPADKIKKLSPSHKVDGLIPVNLESGNFHPPFLTAVDNTVDVIFDNPGRQRFGKAVSGMYLGDILKAAFSLEESEEEFDAQKLIFIMNYPDIYREVYVQVAQWIYDRSAQLVAASLTGLIMLLKSYNKEIRRICLVAEGSLFWSGNRKDKNYNMIAMEKLRELLNLFDLKDVEIDIKNTNNANLIGTGIVVLS